MIEIKDGMEEIIARDEMILKLQEKIDVQCENLKKLLNDYKELNDKYMALEKLTGDTPDVRIDIRRVESLDNWFKATSDVVVFDNGKAVGDIDYAEIKYKKGEGTSVRIDRFF